MLWHDLPHPPGALAGPTNRYRRRDGGGNNHWAPEMGKAGSAYCRSVPPSKPKGPNLPDPELVFEKLLKRKGPFRPHPSGLNRLFFSFATVVIHECFQTKRNEQWINETSSYVDLSTLYGNTGKEQMRVRTYQNGTIHPDSIASERIMLMPPGVVAVLIMFSRNHNAIAYSLWSINEDGKYGDWDDLTDEQKEWYVSSLGTRLVDYKANICNQARRRHFPSCTQHQCWLLRFSRPQRLCRSDLKHTACKFRMVSRFRG